MTKVKKRIYWDACAFIHHFEGVSSYTDALDHLDHQAQARRGRTRREAQRQRPAGLARWPCRFNGPGGNRTRISGIHGGSLASAAVESRALPLSYRPPDPLSL